MTDVVVDASVVLAYLFDESGADAAAEVLPSSLISTVNLSEVVAKLVDAGLPADEACAVAAKLPCRPIPWKEDLAYLGGRLRGSTRRSGLSFGDRACIALGVLAALPVVTADRAWGTLDLGVEIRCIR